MVNQIFIQIIEIIIFNMFSKFHLKTMKIKNEMNKKRSNPKYLRKLEYFGVYSNDQLYIYLL